MNCAFYLDENVDPVIAVQLRRSGIDAVSARDLETLGESDIDHLRRAIQLKRVFCTHDEDFLRMASEGIEHTGMVFAARYGATIGGWVRALRKLHAANTAGEVRNLVFFISVK